MKENIKDSKAKKHLNCTERAGYTLNVLIFIKNLLNHSK